MHIGNFFTNIPGDVVSNSNGFLALILFLGKKEA